VTAPNLAGRPDLHWLAGCSIGESLTTDMRRGLSIFLILLLALLSGCASGSRAVSPHCLSWDARGRLHQVIERDATGYGAVPGYRPVALGNGASIDAGVAGRAICFAFVFNRVNSWLNNGY